MKHETTQTQTLGGGQRVWVALPGRQGRHLKEVALQQQGVWSKLGILQARTFRGQGCRGSTPELGAKAASQAVRRSLWLEGGDTATEKRPVRCQSDHAEPQRGYYPVS